jgi:hypothetical protein
LLQVRRIRALRQGLYQSTEAGLQTAQRQRTSDQQQRRHGGSRGPLRWRNDRSRQRQRERKEFSQRPSVTIDAKDVKGNVLVCDPTRVLVRHTMDTVPTAVNETGSKMIETGTMATICTMKESNKTDLRAPTEMDKALQKGTNKLTKSKTLKKGECDKVSKTPSKGVGNPTSEKERICMDWSMYTSEAKLEWRRLCQTKIDPEVHRRLVQVWDTMPSKFDTGGFDSDNVY